MSTTEKTQHTAGPWKLDAEYPDEILSADGRCVAEVHGARFVGDCQKPEYEVPAEVLANARLVAAAPAMFVALAKLVCPECEHELQHHVSKEGCEIERGDHEGGEGDHGPYPAYAMGPCGCSVDDLKDDYPDFVRALEAIRLAKGESQ